VYRRPKFLEILIEIREEMAREADFDVDLFVERVRSGRNGSRKTYTLAEPETERRSITKKTSERSKKSAKTRDL